MGPCQGTVVRQFSTQDVVARIRARPRASRTEPQQYDFSKAMLSDVLRFLATDAGISFFSLPDDSPVGARLITFSIKASAFQVFETLCKANELSLIPDNGIWYIRPADDKELIGKSYEIRHNALEMVEKVNLTSLGGRSASGRRSSARPPRCTRTFSTHPSAIINDIRAILDLPRRSGGGGGGQRHLHGGAAGATRAGGGESGRRDSNELSADHKPKILWKSDSNTLYVVATRLQHMWVEGYLEAADKMQSMIAIEVKFIETSNDPKRELGIDWTGTLGENGHLQAVNGLHARNRRSRHGGSRQPAEITRTAERRTQVGGSSCDWTNCWRQDLAERLCVPHSGILSATDLSVKLRALLRTRTQRPSLIHAW